MANVSIHSVQGQGYVLSDKPLVGWALIVPALDDKPAAYRWPADAVTYQDVARRLRAEGHAIVPASWRQELPHAQACRVRDIVFTRPLDRPLPSQTHVTYTLATRPAFPGKALLVHGESVEPDSVAGVFCLRAHTFTPGRSVRQGLEVPAFVEGTLGSSVSYPDVIEFARTLLHLLSI